MHVPTARIYVPLKQSIVAVYPGSIIGRLPTAAIQITDPRVSEAHALVSLRGNRLKMVALRGSLRVGDDYVDSLPLEQGVCIELAPGILLFIEDVTLPGSTWMLCGAEQGPVELVVATYSCVPGVGGVGVRLVAEYMEGALAHLWTTAEDLWFRRAGAEPELVLLGHVYAVNGAALQVIRVPLASTSDTLTERSSSAPDPRPGDLVVVARYTSVHIHCERKTAVLSGRPANLVSNLVRQGGRPVPWDTIAQQIWGATADRLDRMLLRQNLDRTLQRLRERLREVGLREDLVALDGTGNIELILGAHDRLVNEM